MTDTSLLHWGIPGMKWGIRRKSSTSSSTTDSADHTHVKNLRGKKLSEMSNDDLKKLTTRLQLEKQYKDLTKVEISPGQKAATKMLVNLGKEYAAPYVTKYVTKFVEKKLNKVFNIKVTPPPHQDPDNPMTPEQLARFLADNKE